MMDQPNNFQSPLPVPPGVAHPPQPNVDYQNHGQAPPPAAPALPTGRSVPDPPAEKPYPVLRHIPVPNKTSWWQSKKQQLAQIPKERGNVALVVSVEGSLELVPSGMALHEFERIRSVTDILFVDTSERLIVVALDLQAAGGHEKRSVSISFRCRVLDPVTVLQAGVAEVWSKLGNWSHGKLQRHSLGIPLEDYEAFYQVVQDELTEGLLADPPLGPMSMDIRLAHTDISLSGELLAHRKKIQSVKRDQELWNSEAGLRRAKREEEEEAKNRAAQRYLEASNHSLEALIALTAADDPAKVDELIDVLKQERGGFSAMTIEQAKNDPIFADKVKRKLLDNIGTSNPPTRARNPFGGDDYSGSQLQDTDDELIELDSVEENDEIASLFEDDETDGEVSNDG